MYQIFSTVNRSDNFCQCPPEPHFNDFYHNPQLYHNSHQSHVYNKFSSIYKACHGTEQYRDEIAWLYISAYRLQGRIQVIWACIYTIYTIKPLQSPGFTGKMKHSIIDCIDTIESYHIFFIHATFYPCPACYTQSRSPVSVLHI